MPSLSELREFKASFDDIGGQKADLAARGIPFDELKMPDFEPESMPGMDEFEDENTDDEVFIDAPSVRKPEAAGRKRHPILS